MNAHAPRRVSTQLALGIFFLPFVFVWLLLSRGYSKFARVIGFGWAALFAISLVIPEHSTRPTGPQKVMQASVKDEKDKCRNEEADRIRKYDSAFSEGRFWDAALEVKHCTEILDSVVLKEKLKLAMIADRTAIISNPQSAPGEKLEAMEFLVREYPQEGAKYESKIPKLKAQVEKETARLAARLEIDQKQRKKREGITLGMTASEVRASSWGAPRDINRTINKWGVSEQWVYDGSYVYFENGVVTAIQN